MTLHVVRFSGNSIFLVALGGAPESCVEVLVQTEHWELLVFDCAEFRSICAR